MRCPELGKITETAGKLLAQNIHDPPISHRETKKLTVLYSPWNKVATDFITPQ